MSKKLLTIIFLLFAGFITTFAVNDLSVHETTSHGSAPGFIDWATLVVAPHGNYVEHSLYLKYSDHNQYNSNSLEIVHRFELPQGAVINDMWLWMGDSVMQAKMYDVWSAQAIYDSIVVTTRDPAFLIKEGSQYTLKVYPLTSGSYRKVKMNYIVPTKYYVSQPATELPMGLLLSDNSVQKPLDILFRTTNTNWGTPSIKENPQWEFDDYVDTLQYHYQHLFIEDITPYPDMNLEFSNNAQNGSFLNFYKMEQDLTYFEVGIDPARLFGIGVDSTSSKKILVSIDINHFASMNLEDELIKYQNAAESALKENDQFMLMVSGKGYSETFTDNLIPATSENISLAFDSFHNSELFDSLNNFPLRKLLFADYDAKDMWDFNNIFEFTDIIQTSDIMQALPHIQNSDIFAAYRHGFDDLINSEQASQIISELDDFFERGGRFLTYYDWNRNPNEKLATHYINGLYCDSADFSAQTLYRNIEGNFGYAFPESITRQLNYFLSYDDQEVKTELTDQYGTPTLISKKIGNGLLVVTGMWSLMDDAAMKSILGAPMLGINMSGESFALDDLLLEIREKTALYNFDQALIFSDSDSLISKIDSKEFIQQYLDEFSSTPPIFKTLNLLNSEFVNFPSVIEDGLEYPGSGYFLKELALQSFGDYYTRDMYDWDFIIELLNAYGAPPFRNAELTVTCDYGSGELIELRDVSENNFATAPKVFLGKCSAAGNLEFKISGRFDGSDTDSVKQFSYDLADSLMGENIIPQMLANETLKDYFSVAPYDTAAIVDLSLMYNLLTDFTALLALEPDENNHFMVDPFDESGLLDVDDEQVESDSVDISIYPNPFNGQVNLRFVMANPTLITAEIFNSLGQRVSVITKNEEVTGEVRYFWHATNDYGTKVASGMYILRVITEDLSTDKKEIFARKLIYLK